MFRWADDSCHRLRCCFLTSYCILMPFAVYQGKKKLSSSDLFVFLEADSLSLGQGTLTISCADTVWPTYGLHLPCCFMLLPASCVSPTSREQYQLIQSFTAFDNSLLRQYG